MATISPPAQPIPSLSPPPPFPPFRTSDLGVPAALLLEGLLAAGRRLAGSTAARIGLGEPFSAGRLGGRQARRLLGVLRLEGEARFRTLAGRLVAREIALKPWADAFKGGVVRLVAAGFHAIHRGKPLTDPQKDAYREAANRQVGFLERFREQVAAGVQKLDGTVVSRAALYAAASWGAAVNGRRKTVTQREEKRVLGPTDHCRSCVAEANRGWQPLGTLREIGDSECKARCACHFIYRDPSEPTTADIRPTPSNMPPPGLPRAAPTATTPTPRAPRKARPKAAAKDASPAPLSLDAARAAQRAANLEAARRGVAGPAGAVDRLLAESARIEAERAAILAAYDARAVAAYVDNRRLTERYSAVLRDPAATRADRLHAEGRLKDVAPRYEELKGTVGVAYDRLGALDERRDAIRARVAAAGKGTAAVPYAELLAKHPDLIPPGPIAERLKAYTLGDAKVAALAKLERGGEDLKARSAALDAEAARLTDDIARLVAEKRELMRPYPGRAQIPPEVAARSRAMQEEIGALAARAAAIPEDRKALVTGGVGAATRAAALEILAVEPGRAMTIASTPVAPGFKGAEGPLSPLEARGDAARADAESWLGRVVVRADTGALATKVGARDDGRPYYKDQGNYMQLSPITGADIVVHEYGHAIEYRVKTGGVAAVDRSREFLEYRVGAEPAASFREVIGKSYAADEVGRKDKFAEAMGSEAMGYYAGKDYGGHATEIISMGLQKLYTDPAGFAASDPEYCKYVMGLIDGSLR